jgi:hypothetical protein
MCDGVGALFQIKRKKLFEKQIDSIYGKKSNIEMQIMALEVTHTLLLLPPHAVALKS